MLRVAVIGLGIVAFTASSADIKMSRSGLCHPPGSTYYERTKTFTPYSTLEACLKAGGKLPKGVTAPVSATAPAISSGEYERHYFGHGWDDADGDCQNSRMEALISQSVASVKFKDSKQCQVVSGKWNSLFTGKTLYDASAIDIDHVVPLKWAWMQGADRWSQSRRIEFANDPINLIAVEASLNRQKGAKGLAEWLPPSNQCQYIVRFLRVAKTYQLSVPDAYQAIKAQHCQ